MAQRRATARFFAITWSPHVVDSCLEVFLFFFFVGEEEGRKAFFAHFLSSLSYAIAQSCTAACVCVRVSTCQCSCDVRGSDNDDQMRKQGFRFFVGAILHRLATLAFRCPPFSTHRTMTCGDFRDVISLHVTTQNVFVVPCRCTRVVLHKMAAMK